MPEPGTILADPAWPLSEAQIEALHEQYADAVEAAMQALPHGLPMPPLADESRDANLTRMSLYGIVTGLLLAWQVPHQAAHWLSIDLAARLLNDSQDQIRYGQAGHA